MIFHQFFKSNQFRHFNPDKMQPPSYMPAVKQILLARVPAASRSVFERYFYAKDFIAMTACSKSNVFQGYFKAGIVKEIPDTP